MKTTWYLGICVSIVLFSCRNHSDDKVNNSKDNSISVYEHQARNGEDLFLSQKFMNLNTSPMQEKLRTIKPFPVGVVYYQQREHGLPEIKKEFQTIRELGFTALKQIVLTSPDNPPGFKKQVFHAALDAGISPWYYGRGGWMNISQDLIDSLGISIEQNGKNEHGIQEHKRMKEFQDKKLRQRINRMHLKPEKPGGMGEPGRNSPYLPLRLIPEFEKWLRKEYQSLEELKEAWNMGYTRPDNVESFREAANLLRTKHTDEFGNRWGELSWDFRRIRDAMRFQADLIIQNYNETMEMFYQWDPEEPERTGGHQLFENQAVNSWDLEAQAKTASIGGSFYSSIHLTHHFFLVDGEITHPVYMQSRIVADMFKGGWSATWESTGGPTQWSGHHNLTVDGELMKQLFLSYIAAGLKGVGIWSWNSRGEGWELGEYALTDIQGEPTERAVMAGKLSKILQNQRFELWDAKDEPMVGVLYSWENEAMLGRMSLGSYQLPTPVYETNRDRHFRQYHSEARIGISRALMNNNIPFEYVTDRDITSGLADRYPVIYLPYILAIDQETFIGLMKYVENGGRLIADFPLMMMDNYGRLNKQLPGSNFRKLFGFSTSDYFHTFNDVPKKLEDMELKTQYGILKIDQDVDVKDFSDNTPAIIKNSYGKGEVRVFNFEAGRLMFKPGNFELEKIIVDEIIEGIRPPFQVDGNKNTLVFRRAAPDADHYFFINNGEEELITLYSEDNSYYNAQLIIENEPIAINNNKINITIPGGSGRWLRVEKNNTD